MVQVAIAKSLGLQTLGIADSIVLPLNTTHYAIELASYLDKLVFSRVPLQVLTDCVLFRVESIASATSLEVDLSGLRASINNLQLSSTALDKEKFKAERDLKRIIKHIIRRRIFKRNARKALCAIKKVFGKKCECPHKKALQVQEAERHHYRHHHDHVPTIKMENGNVVKPRIGRYPGWLKEQREKERTRHGRSGSKKPHLPFEKLKKAVKRVQAVNQKLVAFEKGLIHPDGIKDREWYRHLGVAPGKWLGELAHWAG